MFSNCTIYNTFISSDLYFSIAVKFRKRRTVKNYKRHSLKKSIFNFL